MPTQPRNRFGYSEWAGSIGDLGTLLPLAYALAISNHFPIERLFLLWGLVYIGTGWYFRVPVAVQPLKVMSVIALAKGFAPHQLSTAAWLFGLVMAGLVATGLLGKIERLFAPSIVRGIQLGVGLLLVQKGIQFVFDSGLYLHADLSYPLLQVLGAGLILLILGYLQWARGIQIGFPLLLASIVASAGAGVPMAMPRSSEPLLQLDHPGLDFLLPALAFLIIPQLPLTLGNAVFAASDACHIFWPDRSEKVNPSRLALSIGLSNVLIGLLGGFPICHGSGGMGAHARFGGKTGGTTIILGSALVLVALVPVLRQALFLVPVPLLGALLVLSGLGMVQLITRLRGADNLSVAILVGLVSLATRNLTLALLCGLGTERLLHFVALHRAAHRRLADHAERLS